MAVFDPTLAGTKCHKELIQSELFEDLERREGLEAEQVRQLIESWFADFAKIAAPRKQAEWLGHFRKNHTEQAYFELMVFKLFERAGFKVEIEPTLPDSSKRPDFLITNQSGEEMAVEVTTVAGASRTESKNEKLTTQIESTLADIQRDDFFVMYEVLRAPLNAISRTDIERTICEWLDSLDYNSVREKAESKDTFNDPPNTMATIGNCEIEFTAIPKRRGIGAGSIYGGELRGARWVDTTGGISKAVRRKANKYSDCNYPLLLAVNDLSRGTSIEHGIDTVFGTEAVRVFSDGRAAQITRSDGLFGNIDKPAYTSISGLILTFNVKPWSIAHHNASLFLNPFARRKLNDRLEFLQRWDKVGERVGYHNDAQSFAQQFGLHEDWPKAPEG